MHYPITWTRPHMYKTLVVIHTVQLRSPTPTSTAARRNRNAKPWCARFPRSRMRRARNWHRSIELRHTPNQKLADLTLMFDQRRSQCLLPTVNLIKYAKQHAQTTIHTVTVRFAVLLVEIDVLVRLIFWLVCYDCIRKPWLGSPFHFSPPSLYQSRCSPFLATFPPISLDFPRFLRLLHRNGTLHFFELKSRPS